MCKNGIGYWAYHSIFLKTRYKMVYINMYKHKLQYVIQESM